VSARVKPAASAAVLRIRRLMWFSFDVMGRDGMRDYG
jgi:hypothetical protein